MRFCWSQSLFLLLVIILGISSILSGCGKKGPLYLPEPEQLSEQTPQDS